MTLKQATDQIAAIEMGSRLARIALALEDRVEALRLVKQAMFLIAHIASE